MIKILCSDHFVNMLIEKKIFKFSLDFHCDCESHDEIVVVKCSHRNFFVKPPKNFTDKCFCDENFSC